MLGLTLVILPHVTYSIIGNRQAMTLAAMSGRWERAADIAARLPPEMVAGLHMTLKRLLVRGLVASEVREHRVRVWRIKALGGEELRVWRAVVTARGKDSPEIVGDPYVCPGCFAVDSRCEPGCREEAMRREREASELEEPTVQYDEEDGDV